MTDEKNGDQFDKEHFSMKLAVNLEIPNKTMMSGCVPVLVSK